MPLFERLTASSSPQEIADAYDEFIGLAGGETVANQEQAVNYLSALGISNPAMEQAYNIYQNPTVETPVGVNGVILTLARTSAGIVKVPPVEVLIVPCRFPLLYASVYIPLEAATVVV
jgi:hypothetical protein